MQDYFLEGRANSDDLDIPDRYQNGGLRVFDPRITDCLDEDLREEGKTAEDFDCFDIL